MRRDQQRVVGCFFWEPHKLCVDLASVQGCSDGAGGRQPHFYACACWNPKLLEKLGGRGGHASLFCIWMEILPPPSPPKLAPN